MGILGIRNNTPPIPVVKPMRHQVQKISEVELCNAIKKSNLFPGFHLHEEVGTSGVSCDMVYEDGKRVFTIEAKTQFNFKVLAQACRWRSVASVSYIAVPTGTLHDDSKRIIVQELGLGVIIVDKEWGARFGTHDNPFVPPVPWEHPDIFVYPADWDYWKPIFDRLGENETPAGSKLGKRSTTFSRTIDALRIEAEKHPEYNLQQLLAIVPTHYSNMTSAYSSITRYAKEGVIKKFWND